MNYKVKAVKIIKDGPNVDIEDYEKDVSTFLDSVKEENRLRSIGEYVNIHTEKNEEPHN